MTGKPLVPRARAQRDVEDAIRRYLAEAGAAVVLAFIDALERTYGHISRYPAAGSPRYAHEIDLPGLRFWPLKPFPYLVFYLERTTTLTFGAFSTRNATFRCRCGNLKDL